MKDSSIHAKGRLLKLSLDGEMGHACFRFGGTLVYAVCLAVAYLAGQLAEVNAIGASIGISVYLVFGLSWIGIVAGSVLSYKARRMVSIFLDQAAFSIAWYYGGAAFGPAMWAPVVMVIGNGLRNGPYYARLSTVAGVVCMSIATLYSPFWRSIPAVSTGVILSIIVLPAYVRLLSAQIAQAKRELKLSAERFESASKTDALTGILNRSGFFYALEDLLEEMQADGSSGAVMLLDLDGFKAVNDECGHSAGDAALREVAALLKHCVRAGDTVARYGGDEFVVAMAGGMTSEGIERVAQNLIDTISAMRFQEKPELRIGASIGVCMLPDPRFTIEEQILDEADRLMYQAKRAGKNRFVSTAEPATVVPLVAGMGGRNTY